MQDVRKKSACQASFSRRQGDVFQQTRGVNRERKMWNRGDGRSGRGREIEGISRVLRQEVPGDNQGLQVTTKQQADGTQSSDQDRMKKWQVQESRYL